MRRFSTVPEISAEIDTSGEVPHFRLTPDERCPFLLDDGLCRMIKHYGENMLCRICADHPRFRNYWSDRIELGLGLVCEEAARLILCREHAAKLIMLDEKEDEETTPLTDTEQWLLAFRQNLTEQTTQKMNLTGPRARLMEYLIYRHIPDALYDDKLQHRVNFILDSYQAISEALEKTDGSIEAMIEAVRRFSYDVEYDDEVLRRHIAQAYE